MIFHDLRAIHVHAQKTGGMAVRLTLQEYSQNNEDPGLHWSAMEYRTAYPREFAEYWKFGVVRNPWARWVSWFNADSGTREKYHGHFRAYVLDRGCPVPTQTSRFFDGDGNQIVDYIGRFTALDKVWAHICERLGLPATGLPVINRWPRDHYTTWYDGDQELIDIVAEESREDIARWDFIYGDE